MSKCVVNGALGRQKGDPQKQGKMSERAATGGERLHGGGKQERG